MGCPPPCILWDSPVYFVGPPCILWDPMYFVAPGVFCGTPRVFCGTPGVFCGTPPWSGPRVGCPRVFCRPPGVFCGPPPVVGSRVRGSCKPVHVQFVVTLRTCVFTSGSWAEPGGGGGVSCKPGQVSNGMVAPDTHAHAHTHLHARTHARTHRSKLYVASCIEK